MEEQSSNQSSYKQIFKSSVLIGGSQVFNIIIGIIKNKVLAVMLGPEGVGLMGVYSAITNVITPIAGIGIGSSGVRQIAEAINEEDESKKSFLIKFIRVSLIVASLIAVFFIVVFHEKIAKISFRKEFKDEYLLGVIVIAGVVLFDTLTTGERAILQGARRLRSLASSQILGSLTGAILSILIIYFLGKNGIPFFLLATSFSIFLYYRIYANSISAIAAVNILNPVFKKEINFLFKLGAAFLVTTVAGSLVAYVLRLIIVQKQGIAGVGIYQAGWGLVSMGFNIVLIAMGTDFYPRLVAVSNDVKETNKAVNLQIEVALLFALPIIVGLYIFSPFVLEIFFSKAFLAGSDLTKWLAISCFFKAICWPLGYIIIAKGKKMMFVITSLFWEIVHIPLIYFFMNQYGIEGIGLSFVLDYFLVAIGSTLVSQYFFNFKWAKETLYSIISSFSLIVVLVTINFLKLNSLILFIGGCLILILSIVRMIFIFQKRMNLNFLQILKGKLH